ncbi:MAG: TIGR03790 family protein [Armatimonadota bacterium]
MTTLVSMILAMTSACGNSEPVSLQGIRTTKSVGDANRVLVVMNEKDANSVRIASYYLQKRKISRDQLVSLKTSTADDISPEKYKTEIEAPIKSALAKNKNIDFIVMTKGVPLRLVDQGGYSVDATLASMELNFLPIGQTPGKFGITEGDEEAALKRCKNPYFGSKEPFSHAKFGMYLVNRLTGYTVEDCYKLIDNSMNAKPSKAPILLDSQPKYGPGSGYWGMELSLNEANDKLSAKGLNIYYEKTQNFTNGGEPLAGYCSWGSNDASFDAKAYHELKFVPGAIAETFVSTSGRTFEPTTGGQSLIADLIHQGVTGVKGYVSEPFTVALCKSDILFDRYFNGFNLAESFYAATPLVKWKDIVVGDPLCRPYKK